MRSRPHLYLPLALLLTAVSFPQQSPVPGSSSVDQSATPTTPQIEQALRRYEAAYNHRNLNELLAVWPSLVETKEFKKIKYQFERADIISMKVQLRTESQEMSGSDEVVVRCIRTQEVEQLETSRDYYSDRGISRVPMQYPGPSNEIKKKTAHKTDEIWLTLHKSAEAWAVTSIVEKKRR